VCWCASEFTEGPAIRCLWLQAQGDVGKVHAGCTQLLRRVDQAEAGLEAACTCSCKQPPPLSDDSHKAAVADADAFKRVEHGTPMAPETLSERQLHGRGGPLVRLPYKDHTPCCGPVTPAQWHGPVHSTPSAYLSFTRLQAIWVTLFSSCPSLRGLTKASTVV